MIKIDNVTEVKLVVGGYDVYHNIYDDMVGIIEEKIFVPFDLEEEYDVGTDLICSTCDEKDTCIECSKGIGINRDYINNLKKEHIEKITDITTRVMDSITLIFVGNTLLTLEKAVSLKAYYTDKYNRAKNDMIDDKDEQQLIIDNYESALSAGGKMQDIVREIEKKMISNIGKVESTEKILKKYSSFSIDDISEENLEYILSDIDSIYESS